MPLPIGGRGRTQTSRCAAFVLDNSLPDSKGAVCFWTNTTTHRNIPEIEITKKSHDEDIQTSRQTTELPSLIGALERAAMHTQPITGAPLSVLAGEVTTATIATLKKPSKLLRFLQRSADRPLVLHRRMSPVFVTYSDAAWGFRRDGS